MMDFGKFDRFPIDYFLHARIKVNYGYAKKGKEATKPVLKGKNYVTFNTRASWIFSTNCPPIYL